MFTWLDLIAPYGTALLAMVLSFWAFFSRTASNKGKIISAVTALVFILAIPALWVVRGSSLQPDYLSSFGVQVKNGVHNQCSIHDTKKWVEWTVTFWSVRCKPDRFNKSLKNFLMVCLDEEKLSAAGRHVRGYSRGAVGVIGYRTKNDGKPDTAYTESLFKHELSHLILNKCGAPWDEDEHHRVFAKEKLGH